jgi:hypothetical protein
MRLSNTKEMDTLVQLNLICKDFEHKAKKFEYAEKLEIKRSEKA